jgi:hypothetical protein
MRFIASERMDPTSSALLTIYHPTSVMSSLGQQIEVIANDVFGKFQDLIQKMPTPYQGVSLW